MASNGSLFNTICALSALCERKAHRLSQTPSVLSVSSVAKSEMKQSIIEQLRKALTGSLKRPQWSL